ncbi:MAG TPA: hypothetical protein PLN02_08800, partial [Azonexus sp.]|nr:hypothetical protein [Azonexus sp.]
MAFSLRKQTGFGILLEKPPWGQGKPGGAPRLSGPGLPPHIALHWTDPAFHLADLPTGPEFETALLVRLGV